MSSGNSSVCFVPVECDQPTLLTGYHLLNGTPSGSGFQESGSPPAIQREAHLTSGSGPLLENGEPFVVEGNIPNHNRSPPSTPAPAPMVDESPNLDQNEGDVGCVLHSTLASHFAQ